MVDTHQMRLKKGRQPLTGIPDSGAGILRSYAIYQSKYLQAYEKEGVHIDILMPLNEVQ